MDLLPGLPHDVGLECLTRLPFDHLSKATAVSKGWKAEIHLPEFRHRRRSAGFFQTVIVVAQAWVDPTRKQYPSKLTAPLFYRLALWDTETRDWTDLPPVPEFPDGLPILCHLAGVGSEIVVIGGCDPINWQVFNSVFIYNFLSNTWRRGADMPGEQRFFFACASDLDRMVYVAGGHNEDKTALKSVMAYDVVADEWVQLPSMAKARDECKGIFHRGKFHVIGGYPTELQGRFDCGAEVLDVAAWQWSPVEDDFLGEATCPRTCVVDDGGTPYKCRGGNLMVREGAWWQVLARLPPGMRNIDFVTAWHGKLLVIGYSEYREPRKAYLVNLDDCTWEAIDAPEEYSGHVQSGCYIEI